LDRVYLKNTLKGMTEEDGLRFITPPPSVINAYFAEIYQKQDPQKALDYFAEISQVFDLYQKSPDFNEKKPFIRLNLLGDSFGLVYKNAEREAIVFSELLKVISEKQIFELARVFPGYRVRVEGTYLKLVPNKKEDEIQKQLATSDSQLTDVFQLEDGRIKIVGFNEDEVIELSKHYSGVGEYCFEQRQHILYVTE
jgi:hypothetical protein